MANPVWVLSVDLQTKTAVFQSGMADAARSARKAFQDIGSASGESAAAVGKSSLDVRHSLGLVDNVIRGAHAQAMADVIRLFQHSAVVMTALPFAAVVAGFALVAGIVYEVNQKIAEYRAEQEKLGNDMSRLDTTAQNVFNGLSEKILEAQKRADDLRNNTLGALGKELQLIDRQSLSELVKSFETLDKAAGQVFGDLKKQWYEFSIGSEGAQHALTQFQVQYESLLAKGDETGAGDLLKGTRDSAVAILQDMKIVSQNASRGTIWGPSRENLSEEKARLDLMIAGVGYTEKERIAQAALVQTLNDQLTAQGRIAQLKKDDEDNAKKATANTQSGQASAGARAAVESQLRMATLAIAADRATADARLTIARASVEARLAADIDFAARERDVQLAANAGEIAALDKAGKDYNNQLAALKEKRLEIEQQYETTSATATARASVETAARNLAEMEQGIRDGIEATRRGSVERLAAIEAGMRAEEALNLQGTDAYRELMTQRTEVERQSTEERRLTIAEAAKEEADSAEKFAMIALAADKEAAALRDSAYRASFERRIAQEIQNANQEYAIRMQGLSREIGALDSEGKDYENKLKALLNRQLQLYKQHENDVTAIRSNAEIERNQRILSAEGQFDDKMSQGLTQVLMGQKSFASMMRSIGNEVVSGIIQNAIKSMMANDMTKESDAAAAARKAYVTGENIPVVGPILGPVFAAAAFAGVMAFKGGGIVPGIGNMDSVPAMLTPGEGVVPKGVMAGLSDMAKSGRMSGGTTHNMHYAPTFHVNTIDGDGVRQMLRTHTQEFAEHYHAEARKGNR